MTFEEFIKQQGFELRMNQTFRLARLYVHHCGFSVVPYHARTKKRLFAGTDFQRRPPTDAHLKKWFARTDNNIANVLGGISDNLVILDFDDFRTWSVFHALTGYAGPVVRTGRGVHVYVRVKEMPERNGEGFFDDLHFGQVLVNGAITAPPSVHPNGKTYQWHGSPERIPYLQTLKDIGVDRRASAQAADNSQRPLPKPETRQKHGIKNREAYVSAAINGECMKILNASPGTRNQILYTSALKLAKYTEIMTASAVAAYLESAALQAGLEKQEVTDTIRKGFTVGINHGVLQHGNSTRNTSSLG